MPLLVGGSPSTGSSLLRQMLNRHSAIFCGPETRLMSHPAFYRAWEAQKSNLPEGKVLVVDDIHYARGLHLQDAEMGWTREELHDLAKLSTSFRGFCDAYFGRPLAVHKKRVWAEKTPSNVIAADVFLDTWSEGLFVHIVRHPLDVIASLVERGHSVYLAVARYLFNTAHGAAVQSPRCLTMHYEQLVSQPRESLAPLLSALDLVFEDQILSAGNPKMTQASRMKGWKYSETDKPATGSVGRFNSLDRRIQEEVLCAVQMVTIEQGYASRQRLLHTAVADLADFYKYELPAPVSKLTVSRSGIRLQEWQYRLGCIVRKHAFYLEQRPIELTDGC